MTVPVRAGYLRRMDGRSATLATLAVAAIGFVCFILLDGVAAGATLLVAGALLVVIGVVGWQERRATPSPASGGEAGAVGVEPVSVGEDVIRLPEAVEEEASAPPPRVGEMGAVAEPFGRRQTHAVVDIPPAEETTSPGYAPRPDPTMQVVGTGTRLDHVHDEPLLGHSDLVAHIRDDHEDLAQGGSTIQLRLLHERAHGAPNEPPVNLKIG